MKQEPFEQRFKDFWQTFENQIELKQYSEQFPQEYRQICQHLALARSRNYSPALCHYLNELVINGHNQLYRGNKNWRSAVLSLTSEEIPKALYKNRSYIALAMLLFFVPFFITGFACSQSDELIYAFVSQENLVEIESMYDPQGEHQQSERDVSDDWLMFGFYIKNNIGIGFQTFAGGIFAGIGAIAVVLFNGIYLGAIFGHIINIGYTDTFFPFVVGHGAFELTAIALAGAAGLRLGFAVINPRGHRRIEALKIAGKEAITLVYLVLAMLLLAAFLEAFWSSSKHLPPLVKYITGACFWLLVVSYFTRCMTNSRYAHEPQ